jgi:hypothetical protein
MRMGYCAAAIGWSSRRPVQLSVGHGLPAGHDGQVSLHANHLHSLQDSAARMESALHRSSTSFVVGILPVLNPILFRLTLRPSNDGHLGCPRNLSLAPTLRWNKGAGHVDSVLERPCEPAINFSSFHTASKLPYLFQNVSSFRAPRDACNLMM